MAEIILVDGGSTDATREIARSFQDTGVPLVLLSEECGRGKQLSRGASIACGDVLFFLHADSQLSNGHLEAIAGAMTDKSIDGGNFRLLFDGQSSFSRFMNGFYALIRKFGLYYGDSGLFVRKNVYQALGGFRDDLAVMEDYDFVRRLETRYCTICIQSPPLVTSSRRFDGKHPLAMFWLWFQMHLLFTLGISPEKLRETYYGKHYELKV